MTPNWDEALKIVIPANSTFTLNYRMSPTVRVSELYLYRSRTDEGPQPIKGHGGVGFAETGSYTAGNPSQVQLVWYLVSWEMVAGDPNNVPLPDLGHQSGFWGNDHSGGIFYSNNLDGPGPGVGGGCPDVTAAAYYVLD